jgi:signal transduction histidine kinase
MSRALRGLSPKQLRGWLFLFFLALAIPATVLVVQAYSRLKWEAFHQHQVLAEELAGRIDQGLQAFIRREEARSFTDYAFLVVAGDPAANFLQRSPLSAYPVEPSVDGLIGYFQVDTQGGFSTPLLPQPGIDPGAYGVSARELARRIALADRMGQILSRNRLVQARDAVVMAEAAEPADSVRSRQRRAGERDQAAAQRAPGREDPNALGSGRMEGYALEDAPRSSREETVRGQAAFDRLSAPAAETKAEIQQKLTGKLGRVEDLKLDYRYQRPLPEEESAPASPEPSASLAKRARKERSALPEPSGEPAVASEALEPASPSVSALDISIFESEIDPFEFSLLDSGHLVLFRKVWRNGERYVQGLLLHADAFLDGMIRSVYGDSVLSQMTELIVAYRGEVLSLFNAQRGRDYLGSAPALEGALLYQTRLAAPLGDLQLLFSVTRLPAGPGATLVGAVAVALLLVLCGGFLLLYRLGAGQIALARQQQDFVSAVSHELKTPLTSIRMYGEMLREGWAPEEKKKTYYAFIHDESERLSRLIGNVLQLARMTRNEVSVDPKPVAVSALVDGIRSSVSSQVERAGFQLELDCGEEAGKAVIEVDPDAFTQIMINLVDNALKFARKAEPRRILIACGRQVDGTVLFRVRDYGPGVPRDQMRKIFQLFYRSENELTRETVGTGIGLALVHQFTRAMGGRVDVVNQEPGAEFRLSFPACPEEAPAGGG